DSKPLPKGSSGLSLWRVALLLVLLACLGPGVLSTHAQQEISELEAKARFMILTAPYVDWPANRFAAEDSPIRIAVFGNDKLATELERFIKSQKSSQRRFTVKRINDPQEARDAEMLFIGASESEHT